MHLHNKVIPLILCSVFMAEFSFFFSLPVLGAIDSMSASDVSLCFSGAILLESILMFTATGFFNRFSRKWLLGGGLLLRSVAFSIIFCSQAPIAWFLFFFILSISKAISKPFMREVITEYSEVHQIKKIMTNYSFVQNFAVVIGPMLSALLIKLGVISWMMLIIAGISIVLLFATIILIYDYPQKESGKKISNLSLDLTRKVLQDRNILRLMLSALFCFATMGIFITTTTLISHINTDLSPHSGLFFSIVGICVCIWQGVISKLYDFSDKTSVLSMYIVGVLSSAFVLGGFKVAVLALIFYSVYESIIVPMIYYKSSLITSDISMSVIFSYILVSSNLGQALGSWLTGVIIETGISDMNAMLSLLIISCVVISVWSISSINKSVEEKYV